MVKSKRSRACAIPMKVKMIVWERDNHRCIHCGSPCANPEAHYIPRSDGGLGIEQNIVTVCRDCHRKMDQTKKEIREPILKDTNRYLKSQYPDWDERKLKYDKWRWLHE